MTPAQTRERTSPGAPASGETTTAPAGPGRDLIALALPALGALIAEPLFVLADTAMIGHLGTAQLGGAGVASTLIQTALALFIFLAYGTTPAVARLMGAGQTARALAAGRDGVWLALGLGAAVTGLAAAFGGPVTELMGARGVMAPHALDYIRGSMPGLTAMLAVMALTGVFRGLGDARTPLWIAGGGAALNVGLNALFIYGLGWGVFGSGLGTSATQWTMALVLAGIIGARMRREQVGWAPSLSGVRASAGSGAWLFLRSVTMRAAIFSTLVLITGWGPGAAASHQVLMGMFMLVSLALDAIAIAAQTLIARELGGGSPERAQAFLAVMLRWGMAFGLVTGALLAACSPFAAAWFGQPHLREPIMAGMLVLAASQPLCAVVFVLDGVLIGASDLRYLALVSVATLVFYAGCLAAVGLAFPAGIREVPTAPLAWTWAAWSFGYMAARALSLWLRARSGVWMR